MKEAGVTDYTKFAKECLSVANGRPISFQAWGDTMESLEKQARRICSWGPNVYVKIPIVTVYGLSTVSLIKKLHKEGLKVNVTVVHSVEHLALLQGDVFGSNAEAIVSVFAGGISDSGVSPEFLIRMAVEQFKNYPNIEVLWAGCQRVLSVKEAEWWGCDIVTVPCSVLKKINRIGKELDEVALPKSQLFSNDAENLRF
jgi:transaldolase